MNVVKCGAFLTMLYRLMPESLFAALAISALDTAVTTLIIGPPLRVFTFSRIEAEADLRAALMRAQQCGNQPLVQGVLTKLQTSLSRSNRSRFG